MSSGVDPLVAGLAIGLAAPAYTPSRGDLEEATGRVREFREEPTPELARSARAGLTSTLSPNSRLQAFYHPWTSYVIVPLFALSNAGIELDGGFLRHAYAAPVTLGVLVGYVVGKPIAVVATSWAVTRISRGRVRPPVGWAAVIGSGTISGIGFTVALLIATRALHGVELDRGQARRAVCGGRLRGADRGRLPARRAAAHPTGGPGRCSATPTLIQDLIPEVDLERDHVRGPVDAPITVIEFGDFECPHCGRAEPVVRDLLEDTDVRYVWRHLPLTDVHPQAQLAAEASEAAAAQGKFWEMHDLLLEHQDDAGGQGPDAVRRAARPGRRALPRRAQARRPPDPGRPGRRVRRPQRCLRDADVLRQRPAPLRRLRPRDPERRRAGRAGAGAASAGDPLDDAVLGAGHPERLRARARPRRCRAGARSGRSRSRADGHRSRRVRRAGSSPSGSPRPSSSWDHRPRRRDCPAGSIDPTCFSGSRV